MKTDHRLAVPEAANDSYRLGIRPQVMLVILIALVAAFFLPVAGHQFLLWDDPIYVTRNAEIADGVTWNGLVWAFTEFHAANWHPLTWVSHMIDVELWGMWAGGHHLSSVFWHALNVALLFALLFRTTGALWRSAVVALLFGIHPLHVESVAWVAERKDVLSGFFWLLALVLYERYTRRPVLGRYFAVTAAFAAGLMAKPMLVTLPLIMLLLDVWPLRRLVRVPGDSGWFRSRACAALLLEKLPWLVLALISGLITLRAQTTAIVPVAALPWDERLALAIVAYATYLWQTVWPVELSFFYRSRELSLPVLLAAAATLAAATAGTLHAWRRGGAAPLIGWGWYLISLLPVIGIIKVGPQAHADRYTYLPLIGVFMAFAFSFPAVRRMTPAWRRWGAAATIVFVAAAALISWRQTSYWANDEALYRRALELDPGNFVAHLQLGEAMHLRGDLAAAERAAHEAMSSSSSSPLVAFYGSILLGNINYDRKKISTALNHYQNALQVLPNSPLAHYNVGTAWLVLGDPRLAERHFNEALRHDPRYSDAFSNLGIARSRQGDAAGARKAYLAALEFHPNNQGARFNLARLELQEGRVDAARAQLEEVLRREPGHERARQVLINLQGQIEP